MYLPFYFSRLFSICLYDMKRYKEYSANGIDNSYHYGRVCAELLALHTVTWNIEESNELFLYKISILNRIEVLWNKIKGH